MTKRQPWTQAQKDDFIQWHNKRLEELNYPEEVKKELIDARGKWMPKVDTKLSLCEEMGKHFVDFTSK